MKTISTITGIIILTALCFSFSIRQKKPYALLYTADISAFKNQQVSFFNAIDQADLSSPKGKEAIIDEIHLARLKLKEIDFWLRYFEPSAYKKINGPQPVEWETDPNHKLSKPERMEGAGLSLAEIYIKDGHAIRKDSLLSLVRLSLQALEVFESSNIQQELRFYHHFFLANRLLLLNMAAIYTTGFECPDTNNIIPELHSLLSGVKNIYTSYNASFTTTALSADYMSLYDQMINFVNQQPDNYSAFDHFNFIRRYVTPLFKMNQQFIRQYAVVSNNNENDLTINNNCDAIFNKSLYKAQDDKGVYTNIEDQWILDKIRAAGKLLFYDPILSGNNKRSCASCHKSGEYFTDTAVQTALQFDEKGNLPRNTPSLINVIYNHSLMMDGKHATLQQQAEGVMTSHTEMNSIKEELVKKVMSCPDYKKIFNDLLRYTPHHKWMSFDHIISAITFYYAGFSKYDAPFDDAINNKASIDPDAGKGFNLFMSKALCATCHFIPEFNGVKPPYTNSEFEVLGIPADTAYKTLSNDIGRYDVIPAREMMNAFRTGSLRNIEHTKPYMHNGVFNTLDQVIRFYDEGGGSGKKLQVNNQTLPTDSLKLNATEKKQLLAFLHSLNENIVFEEPPLQLPLSTHAALNTRQVSGVY